MKSSLLASNGKWLAGEACRHYIDWLQMICLDGQLLDRLMHKADVREVGFKRLLGEGILFVGPTNGGTNIFERLAKAADRREEASDLRRGSVMVASCYFARQAIRSLALFRLHPYSHGSLEDRVSGSGE